MKTVSFFALAVLVSGILPVQGKTNLNEGPLEPLPEHVSTTFNIINALSGGHYVNNILDDDLSSRIFEAYLLNMDPGRSFFLQSDIDNFEPWRYEMDDALLKGDLQPVFDMWNLFDERRIARFRQIIARLEAGIDDMDFTLDEELRLDRKDSPWAASEYELNDVWKRRIKHDVLNLRLADKEPDGIQEVLVKRYRTRLGFIQQTRSEEVFQIFMNSFTGTYDPHTQYFSPRNAENFTINMSLSLEGIGAVLQQDVEFTRVVSLVPAGPADKSGLLHPNDKIIGVGQGEEEEIVDVIGWRLSDVVQLIRGRKDTVVRLDIIPQGGEPSQSRIIHITRNTVQLEEQAVSSQTIELEQNGRSHKIGIIDIPTFYFDFKAFSDRDPEYKSTTRDVRKILQELVADGVEGIIVDLRRNGGGALDEAKNVTGLFIDRGPIVQVRSKNSRIHMLHDRDSGSVYKGPLVVLVNRLSASASEIFAGAIQDYQRGIVVGTPTFGKGTVQTLVHLKNDGQLKLTNAKYYRISGDSNQHKGIIPDIGYPQMFDPTTIGESALEGPLLFDTIRPAVWREESSIRHLLPELRARHQQRVETDPEFNYAKDLMAYSIEQENKKTITLNEAARIQQNDDADAFVLTLENRKRTAQGLHPVASLDELIPDREPAVAAVSEEPGVPLLTNDTLGIEDINPDVPAGDSTPPDGDDNPDETIDEEDQPDAFLNETGNILLDLITQQEVWLVEKSQYQPVI